MEKLVFRDRVAFHIADYVIFGLTVAISSVVGIYFAVAGGRQKTTSEYLVGDRKLHVVPVALSLIVSFESSIFMLGFPAEVYGHGTQFWMVHVGLVLTFLCIAQVIVPLMHPVGITSVYQYLELRYRSRAVRLLASALGILYQAFYMGIVLYGPATALEAVTGFQVTYSVLLVAAAAIFYTSLGGIKAVVWTDALQFTIMLGGLTALVVVGCMYVGGFDQMWRLNVEGGRVKFFDFNPSPYIRTSFWTLVIGNSIRTLDIGFNQATVQRVVSVESQKDAKIVVLCLYPGFVLFGTLACLEGMISYAYFAYTECDPYGAGIINNTNQVLPYVVTELFHTLPGLSGLFLASLISASLSTLSSCLSSISAMVWTDFLQPCMKHASQTKATIAAKIVVVVSGTVSIGIAFLIMSIGGPLQQISYGILGSISGPVTGLFFAGCIFPFTNSVGAITGTVFSFGVSMWLSMGSSFSPYTRKTPYLPPAPVHNCYVNTTLNSTVFTTPHPGLNDALDISGWTAIYSISYHYFGPIGMITCMVVALVTSIITGGRRTARQVDPRYIVPVWDRLCCCLPEAWRDRLRLKAHARSRSPQDDFGKQPEEESISLKDAAS